MKTFEELKTGLEECRDNSDIESGHSQADDLLVEIALHESLTLEQKKELVVIYQDVDKWFA
jgi:hypothetical protein